MLPPVDEAVLQNNPDFALLYATLTGTILNQDGTTKHDPAAKERNAVREELKKRRLKAAKRDLLTHAISTAVPAEPSKSAATAIAGPAARRLKPTSASTAKTASTNRNTNTAEPSLPTIITAATPTAALPPALLDLLVLLPPLLTADPPLNPDSLHLLLAHPPLSDLETLLPALADLTSHSLRNSAVHLARLANPNTNPSFLHRAVSTLPTHAASLTTRLATATTSLSAARLASSSSLASLLTTHASAHAALLRFFETKHGAAARSLELRAAEAALLAARQGLGVEAALLAARRDVYGADGGRAAQVALAAYGGHLRDARVRMGEAVRTLKAELAAYGVVVRDGDESGDQDGGGDGDEAGAGEGAKGRTMREMARVYLEMSRQIEDVRADLERLGMGS